MEDKIQYNGRLLRLSKLPFTDKDKRLIYEDLVKCVPTKELAKKWNLSSHGMKRYSLMLMRRKDTTYNPLNTSKKKKENIYDELYPQYKWEELTPYEVRFYNEYEKGRILRRSNLIYIRR